MQHIKVPLLYLSLALALLCQLLPWSGLGIFLHPDFVLLALIYWLLRAPNVCNIGTAWLAGLVIDLASGGLFGQNALAYALTAFFAITYQRRLILFTAAQQFAYVFLLLTLNQTTLFVFKLLAGGENPGWIYFLPCISGMIVWQLFTFSRFGIHVQSHKN
jgi:rod shape-determining protein MreD